MDSSKAPWIEQGLKEDGAVGGNAYAKWYPTVQASEKICSEKEACIGNATSTLKVNNSLVLGEKVPFAPRSGNKVKWYTCGPTVYDVAHMGHARAYLTFDILRRIMEDYFNYEVVYQLNITDIDDKIIIRARRNELLRRFRERAGKGDIAKTDIIEKVLHAAESVQKREQAKLEQLQSELESLRSASPSNSKEIAFVETAVKEQELKLSQASGALASAQEVTQAIGDKEASTEVLDKLIDSAKDALAEALDSEEGHTMGGSSSEGHAIFKAHSSKYEALFHEDMHCLGIRPPTVLTRVSEYVPQVVSYIERIQEKGLAYESNGSVYFDTHAFIGAGFQYRKLEPMPQSTWETITSMNGNASKSEENVGEEKKSQIDFALWKKSKEGEPAWQSPWGPGRPGWHIECSAMATDVLGSNLDIHAGGEDLKFPHHDNEMAQSEAYCGCAQWVNYFWHAGHLHIRGLKMSKSLKNFITIRQALEVHTAAQIRMLFLLQNWDKQMLYSDQMVNDAKTKESMLKNFFGVVKGLLRDVPASKLSDVPQNWGKDEDRLHEDFRICQSKVHASLCNNFDTPAAMEAIFSMVSASNKYINQPGRTQPRVMLLKSIALYITNILRIFGLLEESDEIGFKAAGSGSNKEEVVEKYLDAFVHFRDQIRMFARNNKHTELLDLCDELRDNIMIDLGVRLEDRNLADGQGALWKLDDPAVLRKELEEKIKKQKEAAAQKRKNKAEKLKKELKKWEAVVDTPPEKLFVDDKRFTKLDEKGLPVELASGEPLSKKQSKNFAKEMDKHSTLYSQLQEKPQGAVAYLEVLRQEIASLQIVE